MNRKRVSKNLVKINIPVETQLEILSDKLWLEEYLHVFKLEKPRLYNFLEEEIHTLISKIQQYEVTMDEEENIKNNTNEAYKEEAERLGISPYNYSYMLNNGFEKDIAFLAEEAEKELKEIEEQNDFKFDLYDIQDDYNKKRCADLEGDFWRELYNGDIERLGY